MATVHMVPGAAPAPVRPLRLTRRGRVVVRGVTALLGVALLAAAVLLVARPASAGTRARPVALRYHVVLPGETLLGIADRDVPGADPRDVVLEIIQLNDLPGADIRAGQRLVLPSDR